MKLLFIKPKRIGDALLLTGTIRWVKLRHPGAIIHVVVRQGTEDILAGCPEIDAVHLVPGNSENRGTRGLSDALTLVRRLRRERFDHAIELGDADRGRILAVLSGARNRHANATFFCSFLWRRLFSRAESIDIAGLHRAEWDMRVTCSALGIPAGPCTPVFDRSLADFTWVDSLRLRRDPVFVHPVASRPGKMWTSDKWVELLRAVVGAGHPVILGAGPSPQERAYVRGIADSLRSPIVHNSDGALDWKSIAGALYRSQLYLGVDTAAMHLASACDKPIIALFAHPPESDPVQWAPLNPNSVMIAPLENHSTTADISVTMVASAVASKIENLHSQNSPHKYITGGADAPIPARPTHWRR